VFAQDATATVPESCAPGDSLITFGSDRNGDYDVYLMGTDGSQVHNLTNTPGEDFLPTWSPSGSQIAFHSNRTGNWDVYVMNLDGTGVHSLTGDETQDFQASWSPDGSQLVFQSDGDLFIMDADGSDWQHLTETETLELTPSWSPDGSQIVFTANADGDFDIMLIDADGSNLQALTVNDVPDFLPLWSPNGSEIGWTAAVGDVQLPYVMNADGSNPHALSAAVTAGAMGNWSPDGQWVVIASSTNGNSDIYVVDTASGEIVQQLTDSPATDGNPAWSPCVPGILERLAASCFISATNNANLRGGPGTTFSVEGTLKQGAVVQGIGQATGNDGMVWWQLAGESWVRSDLVDETGGCDALPTVSPDA
ncbi:MAG: hypothetical protein ABI835_11900, partial [Chloroflexota bacterium]